VTTPAGFAAKLGRFSSALPKARDAALARAVVYLEGSVQIAAGRHAGRRITATKARYLTLAGDPAAFVKMASRKGHLLDHDTKAHDFGPRRKAALFFPDAAHPFPGPVHSPGTKGIRFFEHGIDLAAPRITQVYQATIAETMIDSFR
jgi:hypothetical protein